MTDRRRSPRRPKRQPEEVASGSRAGRIALWTAIIGVFGAILAAGPDTVLERTKAAFGYYAQTEILRVKRQGENPDTGYVVTLRNPSYEEVVLFGYHVVPVPSSIPASTNDGGSEVTRVAAEDVPARCKAGKRDADLEGHRYPAQEDNGTGSPPLGTEGVLLVRVEVPNLARRLHYQGGLGVRLRRYQVGSGEGGFSASSTTVTGGCPLKNAGQSGSDR